jgi:hypothetical protein
VNQLNVWAMVVNIVDRLQVCIRERRQRRVDRFREGVLVWVWDRAIVAGTS